MALFGKKRQKYKRQTSMPARRLQQHSNTKIYLWRRVIFLFAIIVTVAFAGKIVLGFFNAEYVSLELSGNIHYTDAEIYNVLGEKLENIVTDSEQQTSDYLKESLSYIKEAHVAKHLMKRVLTIEITERKPFALLQYQSSSETGSRAESPVQGSQFSDKSSFFLVDTEGHVLKNIESEKIGQMGTGTLEKMTILQTFSDAPPKVGAAVQRDEVQFGLEILKTARVKEPWLAEKINVIDAREVEKIKVEIEALPVPVWLSGDAIESGLHHTALLLKQHKPRILQLIGEGERKTEPYLDARYQDSLYLGGYTEGN